MSIGAHLREWIGAWPPPARGLTVVATRVRDEPTWDGELRPLVGAVDADGTGIVAVSPAIHQPVTELLHGAPASVLEDAELCRQVGAAAVGEGGVLGAGVLRWTTELTADLEPIGTWLPHTDPRVPPWLAPFGGDALVALEDDAYIGGVGVKRHGPAGHEVAVVTDEEHRGKGIARRLVATAVAHELELVPVVTYLHDPTNAPSAAVADAAGIPDRGWQVLGVFGGDRDG